MAQGSVYVLVNSSIPGLAKVGKTTRPPPERAAERSAATGVATPFVVAFEQDFADCDLAEAEIHAELDRRGLRVAANREFFRGPIGEIIRIVLEAAPEPGAIAARVADPARAAEAALLLEAAERHLHGLDDTMQDVAEAVRLYRLAANRGALVAYERLGRLLALSRRRKRASRSRAMQQLKEGARRGNYYCYAEMAGIYALEGHRENFAKAWAFCVAAREAAPVAEVERGVDRFAHACRDALAICVQFGWPVQHVELLRREAPAIQRILLQEIDAVRDAPERRQGLTLLLRRVDELLPQPASPPRPPRFRFWHRLGAARPRPA